MVDPESSKPRVRHHATVAELLRESPSSEDGGATFVASVRGACMAPALTDGQRVRVRRARWAWPGDVVAFERGAGDSTLAVHRLLGVRPSRAGWVFVTQADNDDTPDPAFAPRRLLGVAELPVSLGQRARSVVRLLPATLAPARRFANRARRSLFPVSPSAPR